MERTENGDQCLVARFFCVITMLLCAGVLSINARREHPPEYCERTHPLHLTSHPNCAPVFARLRHRGYHPVQQQQRHHLRDQGISAENQSACFRLGLVCQCFTRSKWDHVGMVLKYTKNPSEVILVESAGGGVFLCYAQARLK